MLNAKLTVVGGDAKASEVQLRLPTVIGRGREASLTLPHPLVSRRHTEIFERDGRLVVRDLGSLNGTFVNNKRIEGEQVLEPNQLLTLGNVTFRAIYEVSEPKSAVVDDAASGVELPIPVNSARPSADTEPTPDGLDLEEAEVAGVRLSTVEIETGPGDSSDHRSGAEKVHVNDGNPAKPAVDEVNVPVSVAVDTGGARAAGDATGSFDPADFEFDGVDQKSSVSPSQSDLGSFLKKLPR